MLLQFLHLTIILIFSFLDFHLILIGQPEYPFFVDFPELLSFLKFISTFIVFHYFKKFLAFLLKKTKILQKKILIMQCILDLINFVFCLFLVPVLEGKSIFFSRIYFILVFMLILHFLANFFTQKLGLFEIYFGLIISPIMILWTQSVLFKYCMIRSIFNVGPLTLQYIPLVLFYPRDFKAYGHDDVNKVFKGIEKEIFHPQFKYPLAKLFGRQDSFRLIFIIFLYCCFDIFWDYWTTGESE